VHVTDSDHAPEATMTDLPTRLRTDFSIPPEWNGLSVGMIARKFGEPMPGMRGHRLRPVGTVEERRAWFEALAEECSPATTDVTDGPSPAG
jgi:hypothetical protein